MAEQGHWSERGRATSVGNADALAHPRRSVPALVATFTNGTSDTNEERPIDRIPG